MIHECMKNESQVMFSRRSRLFFVMMMMNDDESDAVMMIQMMMIAFFKRMNYVEQAHSQVWITTCKNVKFNVIQQMHSDIEQNLSHAQLELERH